MSAEILKTMSLLFRSHEVSKEYIAIVRGYAQIDGTFLKLFKDFGWEDISY